MSDQAQWLRAVVKVGGGRGFVVKKGGERLIITAGHCLPKMPPCMTFSETHERTYPRLVGPLGKRHLQMQISAECLFVDPVADLAVLGAPDGQDLYDEAQAYEAFVEAARPLPIGRLKLTRPMHRIGESTVLGRPEAECDAWLLSLAGKWFSCRVRAGERAMTISSTAAPIEGGMSGSPILSEDGKAIGVVTTGTATPQPFLARQLPRWLV